MGGIQIPDNAGYLISWQSRIYLFCLGEILPAMQHDQASAATIHYQGTNT